MIEPMIGLCGVALGAIATVGTQWLRGRNSTRAIGVRAEVTERQAIIGTFQRLNSNLEATLNSRNDEIEQRRKDQAECERKYEESRLEVVSLRAEVSELRAQFADTMALVHKLSGTPPAH